MDPRIIPSIEQLRQREGVRALERIYGRDAIVAALRDEADALRRRLIAVPAGSAGAGGPGDASEAASTIERGLETRLGREFRPSLRPAINATGVIIHTNLGRAPLAEAAARRVAEIATGYANLEYDLERGARGARDRHAEALLCRMTGAEAAVVCNNNAAATLLVLAALACGREVVISRGELVEIGGGFRVPDVMAQSGAILREVGTTNKTRAADYGAAIGDRTALILRVHPSNFRIEGFTARPALDEVVAVGCQFRIPVVEDLGSGNLVAGLAGEPTVQASVAAGVDIVCVSGDKLLGGPQAGVILGRRDLVTTVRRHPLMRALRVDKMTYAALEATLFEHLAGRAAGTVPVVRMIALGAAEIEARAGAIADRLAARAGWRTEIIDGLSAIGGGSAPDVRLPTRLLAVSRDGLTPDALEARLRALEPPIIARIENDRVVLDLRTVLPGQDEIVAEALVRAGGEGFKKPSKSIAARGPARARGGRPGRRSP